ncbi:hypothetical protein JTB14_026106 [Gonioctena quinquepunctata]|nr:hypothetical protein JTB14_026106 [Gonioctena quinquepunctata]
MREELGPSAAPNVCYAQFKSSISYGIEFSGAYRSVESTLILQKKVIRAISDLNPSETCRSHFERLQISTVMNLYIYKILLIIFQNRSTLKKTLDIHGYNSRQNKQLASPYIKYDTNRKRPLYTGVKIFNRIPRTIQEIDDIKLFKKELKKLLNSNIFQRMGEFIQYHFRKVR